MFKKRFFMATAFALLFSLFLSSCVGGGIQQPTDTSVISDTEPTSTVPVTDEVTTTPATEPDPAVTDVTTDAPVTEHPATEPPATEPVTEPVVVPAEPVDIKTTGGVVIVGIIGVDDNGWYFTPEQPLNITFEYFIDKPTVYKEQTRISMFAPKDDGVEKANYLGHLVTIEGTLRYYRSDFETLYFAPYTIKFGKTVPESYADEDLMPPTADENLYDPSQPLPEQMDLMVEDGHYVFNLYRVSEETLQRMGNGFAEFYVAFVDAFLNYKSEVECPEKDYAEMLSTVMIHDFPIYNACAQPFEFVKHYNAEKKTVKIHYLYDEAKHKEIIEQFFASANAMLADASPNNSDEQNAKLIYHSLCTRMTYDYSALVDLERKDNYYAYLYNSGVCITFANVYNQLLTSVGINASLAYCDFSDNTSHSWSIIVIDGKQYFCDPTYELSYDKGAGYRFFGITYADRIADGRTGTMGIRYGRYFLYTLTPDMIAEIALAK